MAVAITVTSSTRLSNQRTLTYPANFSQAAHGCPGCLGLKGDCTAAVASQQDVINFILSDGRSGTVLVAVGASDAVVTAAIQAWAAANPKSASPAVGSVVG